MNNAQKILINTLLLTAASFLMQTVGVSFNVWLTAKLGSAGIGRFQLITTVYGLAVTLGCGGVRLAATRLTVEGEAQKQCTKKTVLHCVRFALVTGTFMAVVLFSAADIAAKYWLCDAETALPLRILALSLPFVAMSSALNGYFTAMKKVGRYSAVRILEQGVKIAVVMLLLGKLLQHGEQYGCVAIVIGILVSEGFSFALLFVLYNIEKKKYRDNLQKFSLRSLLHIALPDVTGSGARSVLLTVEHLLIPRGFRKSGVSGEGALSIYGNIHGMVFPLLLYPSAILSSLSGLLIPEIAGCYSAGHHGQIAYIVRRVLRMTLLFSFASCAILYGFSEGLSEVIYHTNESVDVLRLLSPLVPVMYCDMTVDGMLKGLDQQSASMRYNILDSGICVVLVWLILPRFAVSGYIFILYLSEILNFFLSFQRLCKVCTVELNLATDFLMPLLCSIFSVLLGRRILPNACTVPTLTFGILLSVLIYCAALYGFGCLSKEDTRWFMRTTGLYRLRRNPFHTGCIAQRNVV